MNHLEQVIRAGIQAVRPAVLLPSLLIEGTSPLADWHHATSRFLLCMGKAAIDCAQVILQTVACEYFVLAPYEDPNGRIRVHKGSHPIPDAQSFESTAQLISWLQSLPAGGNLLVLLSGGSSSLCVYPLPGLSLQAKMKVNELLIRSGATIHQMNTVRKHLSRVKGGQLGRIASHLKTTVLALSDVIGDDLSVIGSGPFYSDPSTFLEAKQVLDSFDLWTTVPVEVRNIIQAGLDGALPETPKPGSIDIPHHIIASNSIACGAAKAKARDLGYAIAKTDEVLKGDVEDAASHVFEAMKNAQPHTALIWGGEVTVRLKGSGQGGRNQHLALLMTKLLAGKDAAFAAAGTDGVDGNSAAAGAWIDGQTFDRGGAVAYGHALQNFDSYHYFQSIGQNIITGPTGTNVMDLYVAVVPGLHKEAISNIQQKNFQQQKS